MANTYEVIVLYDGYSKLIENGMKANCTCTLIKGPKNIIVDTMTAWDGPAIKAALKQNDLKCADVEYVVCTHGHSDHIGCNYLFTNATHIVGYSISKHDTYSNHDFNMEEYVIDDDIKIIGTPGHTLQDVTVLVKNTHGITAITGDLFEKQEDLEDSNIWKTAGSDSEELQQKNRDKILSIADYIIPGHGAMFKNVKK